MEKLVILDYANCSVHVYDVVPGTDINEEYVENLGFHLSEVSWISGRMAIHFYNRMLE